MKIEKILNNNVAVVRDENGIEKVVMGVGLAYKQSVGLELDESKIDKEFYLANPDNNFRFQELVMDIPLEYLALSEKMITYANTYLGRKLNESIYITLVDHIYTAVLRTQEGIDIKNALMWDIKRFYPDEFKVGLHALDMIDEEFGVRLKDDEAAFIALHFVNAQMDQNVDEVIEITKVIQEVSNIVRYHFRINFDEESVYFYRFITHLKFFAQRLINHTTYNDQGNDDLLMIIQQKYVNAFACAEKIKVFILKEYAYEVSSEEIVYLTIHIQRVVYKNEK